MPAKRSANGGDRDERGRFSKGNRVAVGHGPPRMAVRQRLLRKLPPDAIEQVGERLFELAEAGDVHAMRLFVERIGGKPRTETAALSLDLGELNIVEAEGAIRTMSQQCVKMFNGFIDVFERPKDDMSEQVSALKQVEDDADIMMQEITEYLVRCASNDIGPQNAARIADMLRITQELEECIDCIYRLVKLNERRYKKGRTLSEEQMSSLREYAANTAKFIQFADAHVLEKISKEELAKAKKMAAQARVMRKKFNKSAMNRMADGDVRLEMLNIDLNNYFHSISNHALHVIRTSQTMHE